MSVVQHGGDDEEGPNEVHIEMAEMKHSEMDEAEKVKLVLSGLKELKVPQSLINDVRQHLNE